MNTTRKPTESEGAVLTAETNVLDEDFVELEMPVTHDGNDILPVGLHPCR